MRSDIYNERIRNLIKDEKDEMKSLKIWSKYLEEKIKFPFEAEFIDTDEYWEWEGQKIRVKKIDYFIDMYGIMVEVRIGRYKRILPLCEFEAINLDEESAQALEDYLIWFSNR